MRENTHTVQFLKEFSLYFNSFTEVIKSNLPHIVSVFVICALLATILFLIRKLIQLKELFFEQSVLLELTPPASTDKTAYTTQQLFSVLYDLGNQKTLEDKLLGRKIRFSFEIVSSLEKGIRYIIRTTPTEVANVKRSIVSYLPHVRVKIVDEYFPNTFDVLKTNVVEFKLNKHFAYPLAQQNDLKEHDPVAYITGMMTKLLPNEMIALQLVISPTKNSETNRILRMILRNEDVLGYLNKLKIPMYLLPITFVFGFFIKLINLIGREGSWVVTELMHPNTQTNYALTLQNQTTTSNVRPARVLSTFEQEAVTAVQEKINQSLFEASLRVLIAVNNENNIQERTRGIKSSFGTFSVSKYQSLSAKYNFSLLNKVRLLSFQKRLLSPVSNSSSTLLSISEVADLYHFPYTGVTQTENLVKSHSKDLPAPLSLKNTEKLDVVFAKNTYANSTTEIGLTREERARHMYIIGATGTGKSTLLSSMIKQDITNGNGVCLIDPHGDLAESVLNYIHDNRVSDLIYFNPYDIKYPIGINLLEPTPGLEEDDSLLEKEFIAESVVSLFRKVFSDSLSSHPHRIEYILRNTIHTAFTLENPTLFTIFDLLNNPAFQKKAVQSLKDENLLNFWKYEFAKAGDFQKVKMVAPVTARIGRFLFSPSAKRILEQKRSTINFDEILDTKKILICNLSKGNIGEDTSEVMGIMILNKIQLASLKRARKEQSKRNPFYLYVDEFQNFATPSFVQMLSESRKYGLNLIMAEQSTSQQANKTTTQIILANTGTLVTFRSANPEDEKLLLPQFKPYIEEGEIANLPAFHFYMKKAGITPEEPFSGETILVKAKVNKEKIQTLIDASRKNYASIYQKPINKKVLVEKKIIDPKKKESIDKTETISALT